MTQSNMTPKGVLPKVPPKASVSPTIFGPGVEGLTPEEPEFGPGVEGLTPQVAEEAEESVVTKLLRGFMPSVLEQFQREDVPKDFHRGGISGPFTGALRLPVGPGSGDDKPSAFNALGALWKDWAVRNFAVLHEVGGAAMKDVFGTPARDEEGELGPRGQFVMDDLIKDIGRIWDEAGKGSGDSFDQIAAFTSAIDERRHERDPYFMGEKIISEMVDPIIFLGWGGKLLSKLGPAGRMLAPIDKKFTEITEGIVNVVLPVGPIRRGVAVAGLHKAEGLPIKVGSRAWFFQPLVTRNQAIRRATNAASQRYRVSLAGDIAENRVGAVGEHFARITEGLGRGWSKNMTPAETETALFLNRIKDSMSPERHAGWLDNITNSSPRDSIKIFEDAVQQTYTEKGMEIAANAQRQRGTIGKVLAYPGAITNFIDVKGYHWLSQNFLRPLPRLFLATLNYPPANAIEEVTRSLLGGVTPSMMRGDDFMRSVGMFDGVPPEILEHGLGITVATDVAAQFDNVVNPKAWSGTGAMAGLKSTPWRKISTPWRKWKEGTIGLSKDLTLPIQRNFYYQRVVKYTQEDWVRIGLNETNAGARLRNIIQGTWSPHEVENLPALQNEFLFALISKDPVAIDAVVTKYTAARVQERLVNSALKGQPMATSVQGPMREWGERGGRIDELPDVLDKMKNAKLIELKASPDITTIYLNDLIAATEKNIGDIKTVKEARAVFNTLVMTSQELTTLGRAITRATGHEASNPLLAGRTRTALWEDARKTLKEMEPKITDALAASDDLMEKLINKFPRGTGAMAADLIALQKHQRLINAAHQKAATIAHSDTLMAEILAKTGGRKNDAFWAAYYETVEGAWEVAFKTMKTETDKLLTTLSKSAKGQIPDGLADRALASSQWEDFLARLSQLEVQVTKDVTHPALSKKTADKLAGIANQLKSAVGLMDVASVPGAIVDPRVRRRARDVFRRAGAGTAVRPARMRADDLSETGRLLEVLRGGGQFTDPLTGKVANYEGAGNLALTDFKNAFTNYDDLTALDSVMTHLVPFWVYGSRASMYLGRQFIEKPKFFHLMNPWNGQFWEYTENGYIEIPLGKAFPVLEGTPLEDLQLNPFKSTVYGRMTNAFTRPVYEPQQEGVAGKISRMIDYAGKAGAWPHSIIGVAPTVMEMLQGKTRLGVPSELVPPVAGNAMDILTAASPGTLGPYLRVIFPDDFHDRLISVAMAKQGIKPQYNIETGQFENPSEELSDGMRTAALWQLVIEQMGVFRVRPEGLVQFQKGMDGKIRQSLIEIDGYTEAELDELITRRGGLIVPFTERVPLYQEIALSPITRDLIKTVEGFDLWSRVNDPLTPAQQSAVKHAQRKYWDVWNRLRDEALGDETTDGQRRDDKDAFGRDPTDPSYLPAADWREQYNKRWSDFANQAKGVNATTAFVMTPDGPKGLPFTEEEQYYYRRTTGLPIPLVHSDERVLRDYYQIAPEMFPDPNDPSNTDWGAFHAARAATLAPLDKVQRERLVEHMHRNETETMKEFRIGNSTFMQMYWDVDRMGMAFHQSRGEEDIAAMWKRALDAQPGERALLEQIRHSGNFDDEPNTRTKNILSNLRGDYRQRISTSSWWEPGSLAWERAQQIQAFLRKFFPERAKGQR